jgi:hypothetical protein
MSVVIRIRFEHLEFYLDVICTYNTKYDPSGSVPIVRADEEEGL